MQNQNRPQTIAADKLVERLHDAFLRQIAWYEQALSVLSGIGKDRRPEEFESLFDNGALWMTEIAQFNNELDALSGMWQHADVTQQERVRMAALARRAEDLSQEVKSAYDAAISQIEKCGASVAANLAAFKRGRNLLDKYLPQLQPDADIIDKKA